MGTEMFEILIKKITGRLRTRAHFSFRVCIHPLSINRPFSLELSNGR